MNRNGHDNTGRSGKFMAQTCDADRDRDIRASIVEMTTNTSLPVRARFDGQGGYGEAGYNDVPASRIHALPGQVAESGRLEHPFR